MPRLLTSFALPLCLALLSVQALTAQKYTVTDLGTLGGIQSVGIDINQSGDVTGSSGLTCQGCYSHAFLYRNGKMQDLGTLGTGSVSEGYGISGGEMEGKWKRERGEKVQVTGYSHILPCSGSDCGPVHAFLYSNGTMQDLGTLPSGTQSEGFAVNSDGQVTGWADVSDKQRTFFTQHAFLYSDSKMQDLGTLPGGTVSFGLGINDRERSERKGREQKDSEQESGVQITGFSSSAAAVFEHAFVYSNGTMKDLGTLPGGRASSGNAINQSGQVTGYSEIPGPNIHAFLYSNGTMQDLGTLPGTSDSFGRGINQSADVAGFSQIFQDFQFHSHAFLYSSQGNMQALDNLIPPNSGWVLEIANAINDHGQITGSGTHNGATRAFLLTPICSQNREHDMDNHGCDNEGQH
jgi:probable HAF family extracellular repeat protein